MISLTPIKLQMSIKFILNISKLFLNCLKKEKISIEKINEQNLQINKFNIQIFRIIKYTLIRAFNLKEFSILNVFLSKFLKLQKIQIYNLKFFWEWIKNTGFNNIIFNTIMKYINIP